MFCTECGARLEGGARRCESCGVQVEGTPEPSVARPAEDVMPRPAPVAEPVPQPAMGAPLSFGEWRVEAQCVIANAGTIPLDQVSCCAYDSAPRNLLHILVGAVIAVTGLWLMTEGNTGFGAVAAAIGGVILFLALQSKKKFRLYSTSGHFFELGSVEMDLAGNRVREFQQFNAALVAHRHHYLLEVSAGR